VANSPRHRVLIVGILSPLISASAGFAVYNSLTRASAAPDKDFLFRLSMVSVAMAAPFFVTLALTVPRWRRGSLTRSEKLGLGVAALSLVLTGVPVSSLITRSRQSSNLALSEVPAPAFDTKDIRGQSHRLEDHRGKVVIVNVWATWCGPCRWEMPELDRLYAERKDEGFIVFGFSTEDVNLQRSFVEEVVPVRYPLLTTNGVVPSIYRDIERYPAIFLIDRKGMLQPAPGPDEPFDKLRAAVDALLASG
jgi:thiol-disulfide isomerase/thioredoxin